MNKMLPKFLPFIYLTLMNVNPIPIPNINAQAQPLFPTILFFGDSFVDTCNNNFISSYKSLIRADHPPYGRDFPGHKPTGRFSNGKLIPDFIAETLGLKEVVPPYLDPGLSDSDLLTGVNFASAGSGFDELTTTITRAIPLSKQLEYSREYIKRVKKIVGEKKGMERIKKALVLIIAGNNDFAISYYDLPIRRLEYKCIMLRYQDFILTRLQSFLEELHVLGCHTMVVAGLPPIGCLPIQMTAKFQKPKDRTCLDDQNSDAKSYNQKLQKLIPQLQASLPGSQILYANVYTPVINMIEKPQDYGFAVTDRGCCETGYIELGSLCNKLSPTCENDSELIFWDSAHFTEAAYKLIYEYLLRTRF